jgi:glycosyltransferase involved in cell wall biosynthesis
MFVSFVVATYNCVDRVPILNDTVAALEATGCEFCISDGGSNDGTLDALSRASNVRVLCSRPDRGIYDAWNRALDECRGEYFAFIGVDDRPQPGFIRAAERFCATTEPHPAVIYGDRVLERGHYQRRIAYRDRPRLFEADQPVFDIPHQAALNHRSLFESRRFDANYRLAGDLEFYVAARASIRERGYLRLPDVQVIAAEDGVSRSASSFGTYLDEFLRIERTHDLSLGYSKGKLLFLKQLGRFPNFFALLKSLSWALRHDAP